MMEKTVKTLDERDLEFIETLQRIGIQRNVATLIAFLSNGENASSRDIEVGTTLRQPEVSIGMRTLRENNWIEETEVRHEGKGRPMKLYRLRVSVSEIISHYEQELLRRSESLTESINKLKTMISD